MHKSEIIAVFLAAILFTGAFTVSLPSFIIEDAEAAASDKRDIKDRDIYKSYDKYYEEYDDKKSSYDGYDDEKKYPNEKKEYHYYDKYSTYGQDNIDLQCEECIKYWLYTLMNQGQVRDFVNALAKYINHINWGEGVDCTVLDAPFNPPDNKLPGVECLSIADAKKKKHDLAQVFEICQQIELAIQYITEKDKTTDIATAFETFATGFEDAISPSCANEPTGAQLCRTAEGLLECLEEIFVPLLEEEEEIHDNGYNMNGNTITPIDGVWY